MPPGFNPQYYKTKQNKTKQNKQKKPNAMMDLLISYKLDLILWDLKVIGYLTCFCKVLAISRSSVN